MDTSIKLPEGVQLLSPDSDEYNITDGTDNGYGQLCVMHADLLENSWLVQCTSFMYLNVEQLRWMLKKLEEQSGDQAS